MMRVILVCSVFIYVTIVPANAFAISNNTDVSSTPESADFDIVGILQAALIANGRLEHSKTEQHYPNQLMPLVESDDKNDEDINQLVMSLLFDQQFSLNNMRDFDKKLLHIKLSLSKHASRDVDQTNNIPSTQSQSQAEKRNGRITLHEQEQLPHIYTDSCKSFSEFLLLKEAKDDLLRTVQILPNTWVWTTKCLHEGSTCSGTASNTHTRCQQKHGWVQAFARLTENDPWRWNWIMVENACTCGIRVSF